MKKVFFGFQAKSGVYTVVGVVEDGESNWTDIPHISSKNWIEFTRRVEEHFKGEKIKIKPMKKRGKR